MPHRNRGRTVSVVLPALLAAACGRGFVMPPAKARLPGYQLKTSFSEGLAVVQKSGDLLRGYVDAKGQLVVPARFQDAERFSEGLAAAREEYREGYGFIDRTGQFVIAPGYDAALPFSEGLAAVLVDGRWGFVDRAGALRIPPRFDDAGPFREGRARVVVEGLAGFFGTAGEVVAGPAWFRAGDFHEGLAAVCDRSRCGFVDLSGKLAVPISFDDAGHFAGGLAPVRVGEKWGYVDAKGRMTIAPAFDEAEPFSEGLARVGVVKDGTFDTKFGGYSGRRLITGFVDSAGRWAFEPKMLGATAFSGGFTAVRLPAGGLCSDCEDVRLMSKDGSFLPGRFDMVRPFSEGLAVVTKGPKSWVVDEAASPLVELDAGVVEEGAGSVATHVPHRFGFVDAEGRAVVPHELISAQSFSEGLALVEERVDRHGRRRRFVDRNGTTVLEVPTTIGQALPFSGGLSLVSVTTERETRYGFMDRTGAFAIPAQFAGASSFSEGLAAVKVSSDLGANDWGYVDPKGTFVVAPGFKAAGPFSNGLAYVERVTEKHILVSAVIDRSGRVVVEKPFLNDLSGSLFGTPSVEQFRRLRSFAFGERLVPRVEARGPSWGGPDGRTVVPASPLAMVGLFSEGLAPVQARSGSPSGVSWGYADPSGKVVVPAVHAAALPFSEGLGLVRDAAGRWGWVTPTGEWSIAPMWLEEARPFSGGRALVRLNGRWGYLDRSGRFAVPPRFVRAEPFSEGFAVTAVATGRSPSVKRDAR